MVTRLHAHEIRPAVSTITLDGKGGFKNVVALNLEALLAGIGPEHTDSNDAPQAAAYDALRRLPPAQLGERFKAFAPRWLAGLDVRFDGQRASDLTIADVAVPDVGDPSIARIGRVTVTGAVPPAASAVTAAYAQSFGSMVLRLVTAEGATIEGGWLKDGETSRALALSGADTEGWFERFFRYLALGFTHILPKGLDHILFVVGLYLLSTDWRSLLVQVTAFTLAHSITLALGLYGVVDLPPDIVEPLIALSIVYVAVENLTTSTLKPWRPVIVFLFGLLHGLGFAGILSEVGLPRDQYLGALIAFNIGVELGQLAVIALAFALTGFWFRNAPWYRQRIVWPASLAIALVGTWWTVERIWLA